MEPADALAAEAAETMATTTGVAPMIRAAFETLVRATPLAKQNW